MRIGLVCPYGLDVAGGVQNHVRDLAHYLQGRGHEVGVLAPVDDPEATGTALADYVTRAGRTVAVPYNGSVARVAFGPVAASRTRRWIRESAFDVLHVHEPASPSVSMIACFAATGPLVATFHSATPRSRALSVASSILQIGLDKISARIAVSEQARLTLVDHLESDAAVIPNGIYAEPFAAAARAADGQRATRGTAGPPRLVFLGRLSESRKGLPVLLAALPAVLDRFPDVQLDVIGRGDTEAMRADLDPRLQAAVRFHGEVDDAGKARILAESDVYVAPHTGQESFGIVLVEAMAAGAPVVASALPAFADVLENGALGVLVAPDDPAALAAGILGLLADPGRRAELRTAALRAAAGYDWSVIGQRIEAVYDLVTGPPDAAAQPVRTAGDARPGARRDRA